MFAYQLISNEIFALKPSDSATNALVFMEDWQVKDLPIVQNLKVVGIVNEQILLNNENENLVNVLNPTPIYCFENTHFYDVLRIVFNSNLSTIPVVDSEQNFKGIIAAKDLAKHLYQNSTLNQDGGILVLQMNAQSYSLAEIARITEVNNAKILYAHVFPLADENNNVQVSLKYNVVDLKYIIATFERFNYQIIFNTPNLNEDDSTNKKFDWLMKYLNT
jgi:predicted transcriptional regulator